MDRQTNFEMLSAYLDGELDESAARDVERMLERDPEAWAHVQALREFDGALRASLAAPARLTPPDRLTNVIETAFDGRTAVNRGAFARRALPIAASVALAVVAGAAGYMASDFFQKGPVELAQRAENSERRILAVTVNHALETQISGHSVSWRAPESGEHGAITPVRTYRSKSGHWCREYRVQVTGAGQKRSWRGLACRTPKDGWVTVQERFYR